MRGGGVWGRGRCRENRGRGGGGSRHVIVGGGGYRGGGGRGGATMLLGLLIGRGVARGGGSTRGYGMRGLGRKNPRRRERLFAIRTCRMRTWTFVKPLSESKARRVSE